MWNAVESSCSISSAKLYATGQLKSSQNLKKPQRWDHPVQKRSILGTHTILSIAVHWQTSLVNQQPPFFKPYHCQYPLTSNLCQSARWAKHILSTACWLLEVWSMTCLKIEGRQKREGRDSFLWCCPVLALHWRLCVHNLGIPSSCSNFAPTFHIDLFFCCSVSMSFPSPPYPFLLVLLFHLWRTPPIHLQKFQFSRSVSH